MIDATTKKPVRVLTDGGAGPYIRALLDQLPEIRRVLDENHIRYWVDEHAISLNGHPAVIVINLARGVDAAAIQKLLDDEQ